MFFEVSVILPVYNAENYLENSVHSALAIDCVREVLLIEDGSPDNALWLCEQLTKKYSRVKLLRHPNGENRGAGASRNLGIINAISDYIAFLDADDWYLPNRFEAEKTIFKNANLDGVYGGTGFYKENVGLEEGRLTTLNSKVSSKNLLYELVSHNGHFHTNAITIKKELFNRTGLFNTSLKLHQDTHLWYRLAYFGKLEPGLIDEAIAIRRVHEENRITHKNRKSRNLLHQAVFNDFKKYNNVDKNSMRIISNRYIQAISGTNPFRKLLNYSKVFLKYPKLIFSYI